MHGRLAWAIFAATAGLALTGTFLRFQNDPQSAPGLLLNLLVALPFPLVAAVLAWRRPENPIGWIMLGFVAIGQVQFLAREYAAYATLIRPGSLPVGEFAAIAAQTFMSRIAA